MATKATCKILYLVLQLQGARVHNSRTEEMKQGQAWRLEEQLSPHILNCKHEAEGKN